MNGVQIGDKHTWKDWQLYLQALHVSVPIVKSNAINLPGVNGTVDLTDYPDGPVYDNRIIIMEFQAVDSGYSGMLDIMSRISGEIQGKRLNLVLDDDSGYYYTGRCVVESSKINEMVSGITITAEVEPYKYEGNTGKDWMWDSFSFRSGIIRKYEGITVNDLYRLVIPGRDKRILPIITVSAAMTVEYLGHVYNLLPGKNKIYDIRLGSGEHTLIFRGRGVISVDYVGGML